MGVAVRPDPGAEDPRADGRERARDAPEQGARRSQISGPDAAPGNRGRAGRRGGGDPGRRDERGGGADLGGPAPRRERRPVRRDRVAPGEDGDTPGYGGRDRPGPA